MNDARWLNQMRKKYWGKKKVKLRKTQRDIKKNFNKESAEAKETYHL